MTDAELTDAEFDRALVAAAFQLADERGWSEVTVTAAARQADLKLDRARERFMGLASILGRFGRIADQAALAHASADGGSRDRLFDVVMRRIDVLQAHRAGVLALRAYLPRHLGLALMLGAANDASMAWLLEASGIPTTGLRGKLRVRGMMAVWLYTLRAWQDDELEDLSTTMAALDRALDRAVQVEGWMGFNRDAGAAMPPDMDPAEMAAMDLEPLQDDALDRASLGSSDVNPPPPPAIDPPESPPS